MLVFELDELNKTGNHWRIIPCFIMTQIWFHSIQIQFFNQSETMVAILGV
jgi:hypothetical protein